MKKILELLDEELGQAFRAAGYDEKYARSALSNRPDLCEYQCNGAMAAAKEYHKAPIQIAEAVVEQLQDSKLIADVQAVKPGFINLKLSAESLSAYLGGMRADERLGCEKAQQPKTIIIDYGGPNVAKPLHVGHLRSAIIGESVKRIARFAGHTVIGDVHLGDWGLQMGLIITELKERRPELPYFDETYEGEYPAEAPFTISELEEIYPTASARSKEDAEYKEAAMQATFELQHGRRGYQALLGHILNVSVTDLKRNYQNLNVEFDLWKGESDAQPYIPDMVQRMRDEGYAYLSDGAWVVDVKEESDTKEVPPCMLLKSDGASLYTTTDLATIVEREKDYHPDEIIYVVDKRQEMHFIQVFRCAKKCGLVGENTKFTFLGFGTMNGKDGKPFKTREGGVMRLEYLIENINEEMLKKIQQSRPMDDAEAEETAKIVGLAALKYGDLSNQASKDYIFDVDRFTSSEGNTGPYILYTIVRIKSILKKYAELGEESDGVEIRPATSESEKALQLELAKLNGVMESACEEYAPHRVCAYIYDLANAFNKFYHETKIFGVEDREVRAGYIELLNLTKRVLETCIDVLGFEAPERM
ncbi:MAG: arginine--tRNA ligase [Lachnospiraceae bacterium]|nr:arginine--tRNA ligase [Lachnospiraceae bacterium]